MYIRRVVLRNVRGIRELDLDFSRSDGNYSGWHVVTGDNGSGKTTFLKAIALALVGPDVARVLQESFAGWIRSGCDEGVLAVEIVAGPRDTFVRGRRHERPFWAELKCVASSGHVSLAIANEFKGKDRGPAHGPWADEPSGWFSAGYGPFRRLHGASAAAQRIMSGPPRIARFATMFREDATLGECEQWLRDLQHKALEGRERERRVLEQITRLLNDDFLRNGLTVERVDSEGLWLREANGVLLPLSNMSEGYRAALALLVDLLRHIAATYGSENLVEERSGVCVVPHSGVVLVDEMDSHLHPEWQRKIGFWLTRRFPEMQFLVTSHSAMICQAAVEDGIFHLPEPGSDAAPFRLRGDDYRRIVRSTPDAILLSPAFGLEHTRSPVAVSSRRRFAELRSKKAASKLTAREQAEMQQLCLFVEESEDGEVHAANPAT